MSAMNAMSIMQVTLPSNWTGHESMLRPSSPQAHAVYGLWNFMFVISTVVYVLVIAALAYAVIHARKGTHTSEVDRERKMRRVVTAATGVTILVLFATLVYDFGVGRATAAPLRAPGTLHISVAGHQWWWEVQYDDTAPQRQLSTANEIHVPVHRPIVFTLTSSDVIHSFWLPNLNGKKDLVPGHPNDVWFQADTPGVYRGQCAEFCGLEHAKMALLIVAEPEAKFNQWYEEQLKPAATPADAERAAGQQVFLAGSCAMCHAIQGTGAGARYGPDLTHFGSRLMLAANTVPNTRAYLGGWVVDPQVLKPGAKMPPNALSPRDLRALLAYLEGLK
ncbi:MAG: cytochrome c oxidase subunit II [Gemmatimonadaceae bacterium]